MLPFSRSECASARSASPDSEGAVAGLIEDWPEAAGGLARNDGADLVGDDCECPDATLTKRISSKQTMAATEEKENLVSKTWGHPGGVPDVWHEKDLEKRK
jgi:hypothetical protein